MEKKSTAENDSGTEEVVGESAALVAPAPERRKGWPKGIKRGPRKTPKTAPVVAKQVRRRAIPRSLNGGGGGGGDLAAMLQILELASR